MTRFIPMLSAALLLTLSAGEVQAGSVFATDATVIDAGSRPINPDRDDPAAALGASDGAFYALGVGGTLDVGFGRSFAAGSTATIHEVTFGDVSEWPEAVEVFALAGGVLGGSMGVIGNMGAQTGLSLVITEGFDGLRFVDMTPAGGPSTDGFDIDSISIAAIPLPAAGGLMLLGLGGLAMIRRRRRTQA